jgi:hypothetical protein
MIQEKSNMGKSCWKKAGLYLLTSSIILSMLSPRVAGVGITERNMDHPKLLSDVVFNSIEQHHSQTETTRAMPASLVPAIGNMKMVAAPAFIDMGTTGAVAIGGDFSESSSSKKCGFSIK